VSRFQPGKKIPGSCRISIIRHRGKNSPPDFRLLFQGKSIFAAFCSASANPKTSGYSSAHFNKQK